METDAFVGEMMKIAQVGRLRQLGTLLRDSWRGMNADAAHMGWGGRMLKTYSDPTTRANVVGKHLLPMLGFGTLGAGAGAVQQARAAGMEGDPDIRSRVLKGALTGGVLGAAGGSQYFRWGRISAALAKTRSDRLLKQYGTYAPKDVQTLTKVKGKWTPELKGTEGIMNPNIMRTGKGGKQQIEGFGNILRHSAAQGATPGGKALNVLKTLHDQAQLRGYVGRGTLTQFVPHVLGSKLMYLPIGYGAAKSVLAPEPGESRMGGALSGAVSGVGGVLTNRAGMLLNMGTLMGPKMLNKPAPGAAVEG